MKKLIRSLTLVLATAVLTTAAWSYAEAQNKDTKDKKEEKLGTVELFKGKDGYRFRVKDTEGKVIAQCTKGYEKKEEASKALSNVKEILTKTKVIEVEAK